MEETYCDAKAHMTVTLLAALDEPACRLQQSVDLSDSMPASSRPNLGARGGQLQEIQTISIAADHAVAR